MSATDNAWRAAHDAAADHGRYIVERHHGDRWRVTDVATDQIVGKPYPDHALAAAACAALNTPTATRTRPTPATRQPGLFDHQEAS